jgi:hypothetical protein
VRVEVLLLHLVGVLLGGSLFLKTRATFLALAAWSPPVESQVVRLYPARL